MTDFGFAQMPVHLMSDGGLQPVMRGKCVLALKTMCMFIDAQDYP